MWGSQTRVGSSFLLLFLAIRHLKKVLRKYCKLLFQHQAIFVSLTIFIFNDMKKLISTIIILSLSTLTITAQTYRMENKHLARIIQVTDGRLHTQTILNKQAQTELTPTSCDEFSLRFSIPGETENTDYILSAKDFIVTSVSPYANPERPESKGYQFQLRGKENDFSLIVYYELASNDAFCRKSLRFTSNQDILLKRVNVEAIAFEDAYQNYTLKKITARGSAQWKPGLGQPVYTTKTGTFWGIEFPAANNEVSNGQINCGYLWGQIISKNTPYTSYNSIIGVSDDVHAIDNAFYTYINKIRKRPLRLQIQYNSWFDYSRKVSKEKFIRSVEKINDELVTKRGCQPLNAYIIDDGWQDTSKEADWSDKVWTINSKFQPDFTDCFHSVQKAHSQLGLWLSPGCLFGGHPMMPRMQEYGFETLSYGMSMTGKKYMLKLEERVLELARMGISYFKFDGLFGHLNLRDFDIADNPFPSSNDERLNDSHFDEQKGYYLSAGTERLIQIFDKLNTVNPDIFIAITNGAYLSPWWLQYIDIVWLINAGDAAKGDNRTGELVYRDQIYHQIWKEENTKFPMSAIFNHEPKKTQTNETPETFRDYLYMNFSRGTGFIELYIKTDSLSPTDWDILSDGLKWARKAFPTFNNVVMHGGSPQRNEVYGYTAWTEKQGYISLHNPSEKSQSYHLKLDKALGVPETKKRFKVDSPITNIQERSLSRHYHYGDTISVTLSPKEIIILDFIR